MVKHYSISGIFVHHIQATVAAHRHLRTVEEDDIAADPALPVSIMQSIGDLRERQFPAFLFDDNARDALVVLVTVNANSAFHTIFSSRIIRFADNFKCICLVHSEKSAGFEMPVTQ